MTQHILVLHHMLEEARALTQSSTAKWPHFTWTTINCFGVARWESGTCPADFGHVYGRHDITPWLRHLLHAFHAVLGC
jgi:hypothetical protein